VAVPPSASDFNAKISCAVKPQAFISYRRDDSQHAALGIFFQLQARLGLDHIFMDRSGIAAGNVWAERLDRAVQEATLLLVVIGPGWLRAADEYGRRRLDLPHDWVRREIQLGIEMNKPFIPLLIGSDTKLPPAEALPPDLARLVAKQAHSLREDHWNADIAELVELLERDYGFIPQPRVPAPDPRVTIAVLSDAELDRKLVSLPGWEPIESFIPGDYPKTRRELRKAYNFPSFRSAIEFMYTAVDSIDKAKPPHHPRWENQWKTVTVYLSTWDVGFKISVLDIKLAKLLDALYKQQTGRNK
jgi:pterin-4a-carbinolamine dehydratase